MKKLIYCALALAAGLFASSCQQENLEPVAKGNTVTYTVEVPGVATKAADPNRFIGDGQNVDQLIYEVWKTESKNDKVLTEVEKKTYLLYRSETVVSEGKAIVSVDLVNNQNYTILFWAQVREGEHYNTESLKNVQLVNTTDAFDESRAAFFGIDCIDKDEARKSRQTVTLHRPFGQINLGTVVKSKANLGYELSVEETAVTVSGVATAFNVAAGAPVNSGETLEFSVAAPDKNAEIYPEKTIDVTVDGNTTNYQWISMNYIFVPANQTTVEVSYDITTNHGLVENTISNVPAQINYKTNIVGNLLTSQTEYTVVLDNNWDGTYVENVVTVTSASDLQTAINNAPEDTATATNIKIDVQPNANGEKILDLSEAFAGLMSTKAGEGEQKNYGIQIPANKSIVLDLNGCTLSQKVECTESYSMIRNFGSLVIVDSEGAGKISFKDLSQGGSTTWGTYVIENLTGAKLTVENATIEHLGSNCEIGNATNLPVQNYAGKVTINGGALKSPSFRSLRDFTAGGEIIINGGTFEGQVWMQGLGNGTSSLTVNGGEFNPTEGYDGSCIYITNGTNDVQVQINGGMFNTKIGCADALKPGVNGCIKGGTFTTAAIENTNAALIANGYAAELDGDNWVIVPAPVKVDGGYEISNAAQLAYFAKSVNAGETTYNKGVTIKLTDNIDLEGKEWTPIGTSSNIFKGTFDGQGHTVKNLVVNGGSESNKGLFGVTHDGEIKNLVVENAKVSGRLYVAVVAGQPYTSNYTNITVKGHVEVNGMAYVGGVCGYNAYGNYTDITVNVDETSYVKANSVENGNAYRTYVGGVVGFIGEGEHTYKNITSNIDVKGSTVDVGGMFGIAHYGNKFENCVCTGNVEVYAASEAGDAEEIGGIAGVWHNETGYTVSFTNCSFEGSLKANITEGVDLSDNTITGAPYKADGKGKLIIDGAEAVFDVDQLKAAFSAADGEKYILFNNITVSENWDSRYGGKSTKKISIDGNGKTIKFTSTLDDRNHHTVFRFENDAVVKNLKFDLSEAVGTQNRFRAISANTNLTVDNCEFIGNPDVINTRAIIFGEGAGSNLDFNVSITNSEFTNWKRGVTDNENGQDIKSVTVENNRFNNASVNLSAYESIVFNKNILTGSYVDIRTYTKSQGLTVTAQENTLDSAYSGKNVIANCNPANVNAQNGFIFK